MKTSKPLLSIAVILLVSLACNALQSVFATPTPIPTSTPIPPTSTATPIPFTETPLPSPTVESLSLDDLPSRIVFSMFAQTGVYIHTVDADGQNEERLTDNDCVAALPIWSVDGSMIAYYCYASDKIMLWVMNQDGSDAHSVAKFPDLILLRWSPDNQHIVYHAPQPNGMENDIYVLDIATGKSVNLTKKSTVWDAFPNWSPSGDRIVFVSDRAENGKALDDVWVMNADGSDQVNLTNNGNDWEDDFPAWSPDGNSIAFFRSALFEPDEGGPAGLWVMEADGGNPRLVTAIDGYRAGGAPVWSPDGKYLAYAFELDDVEEVWVVPADGGDPVNVSNMPGRKSHISWSPDSKALIFTNDNDEEDTLQIFIALPSGLDTRPLLEYEKYGYGDWAP